MERHSMGRPRSEGEKKERKNFSVSPSLYSDFQKIAYVERRSASDILSELITGYVKEHAAALEEYDKITNK